MKRFSVGCLFVLVASCAASVQAQERGAGFADWAWFQEVQKFDPKASLYYELIVPPGVFDKALLDPPRQLTDLRLVDADNKEVPYALKVQRTEFRRVPVNIRRQFNVVSDEKQHFVQVSLELESDPEARQPLEHNEIELAVSGTNYRRRVEIRGSNTDQFEDAPVLVDKHILRYQEDGQSVDLRTLHYALSRFRYLQVRVYADAGTSEAVPKIERVTVRQTLQVQGRYVTLPARLGQRDLIRGDGGPGSAWFIDLEQTVPVERLLFDVADDNFERPYRLELANPGEAPQTITQGVWRRQPGAKPQPLVIDFPEIAARRLRLVVTDFANNPLAIQSVQYMAPARQLIFALPAAKNYTLPLRLYYGNPHADPPRYDFERTLPTLLQPAPVPVTLEPERTPNPDYQPPPLPLSERMPWLIYVVLLVSSLTLLGILGALARAAVRRHDAAQPAS
jgi:hypothetical protein